MNTFITWSWSLILRKQCFDFRHTGNMSWIMTSLSQEPNQETFFWLLCSNSVVFGVSTVTWSRRSLTVVSSLAALLTRLTRSGAPWWMLPAAGLATLRRGPCSWTWALNSSFEGLSSEALKSNCFDRPGSHSHQPGENLMISIFIRSTYIKKGPSAVPLPSPLCLHPLHPQTVSLLSVILKVVFVPAFHSQWVKRHGITPTPGTCGSIPHRKILFLSQVTHTGFSYLIQWSSITRVQMILIWFHGLLKWAETGKWELPNNWKKIKKELACWMLNKAEAASLSVHFIDI